MIPPASNARERYPPTSASHHGASSPVRSTSMGISQDVVTRDVRCTLYTAANAMTDTLLKVVTVESLGYAQGQNTWPPAGGDRRGP